VKWIDDFLRKNLLRLSATSSTSPKSPPDRGDL